MVVLGFGPLASFAASAQEQSLLTFFPSGLREPLPLTRLSSVLIPTTKGFAFWTVPLIMYTLIDLMKFAVVFYTFAVSRARP
jgi:hypothetical protein